MSLKACVNFMSLMYVSTSVNYNQCKFQLTQKVFVEHAMLFLLACTYCWQPPISSYIYRCVVWSSLVYQRNHPFMEHTGILIITYNKVALYIVLYLWFSC